MHFTSIDCYLFKRINSVPNDKIFDYLKLKTFADDKINVTEKLKFVLGRVGNKVIKSQDCQVKA